MTTIVETLSKKVIPTAFTLLSHKNFPISLLHLPSPSIHPSSSSSKSKLPPAILLTPATGVPAKFYLPFANYLNQTYASPCLIVDYRFSGKSFPAGIRMNDRKGKLDSLLSDQAKEVTYFDWARDEELALQWLVDEYAEEREIVVVCNSVGGHLLPQVKPSLTDRVARALFLGVFAPYHGLAPASEEPQKRARWIDLVAETKSKGYFPGRTHGFGNDLPLRIGLEWAEMMHYPTYWAWNKDFNQFRTEVLSIHFNDDELCYGLASQTDRVLEVFPSSPSTRIAFDPIKQGWGPQGHVNAFLPHNEKGSGINGGVWKVMSDYLIEGKIRNEGGESRLFRGGAGGKGKARL